MRFETALVVDDDPASRTVMRHLLEILGIRVLEARDGREALERLRSEDPQLLVTDIRMPGMTGLELASRVRALERGGAIPVVAVTRHPGEARETELFDLVLSKPIQASVFKDWLQD